MKKAQLVFCVVVFINTTFALNLPDSARPGYAVCITTREGNVFKGLLLSVDDSSVIAYPGNWKEWKKRARYSPVQFSYTRIEEIKLKKKGRVAKGMAIGGTAGALPFVTGNKNETSGAGAAGVLLISVPAGVITGAVIAGKLGKRQPIHGEKELFEKFKQKHIN